MGERMVGADRDGLALSEVMDDLQKKVRDLIAMDRDVQRAIMCRAMMVEVLGTLLLHRGDNRITAESVMNVFRLYSETDAVRRIYDWQVMHGQLSGGIHRSHALAARGEEPSLPQFSRSSW